MRVTLPPAAVYVVPSGAASDARTATPGVSGRIARYRRFMLVEAAPSDAETLVAGGAVRRDDMRGVTLQDARVDPRRRRRTGTGAASAAAYRPATARCSSSSSSSAR